MNIKMAGNFCRRFGVGLRAGADLIQLLNVESKNGTDRHRQAVLTLKQDAQQGTQLSESMEKHAKYFPPLLRSMTRVGEATGRLEHVMLNLAEHYEKQLKLQRSFRKSIIWPGIQLVGGILVISLLIYLMGILPVADILGFGMMGGSGVLKFWGYLSIVFGFLAAIYWAFASNLGGVQNLIPLVYMIPKIGPAIQTITLSRFTWTLSLGLDAGLDPIRSVRLALNSTNSDYYVVGGPKAEVAIRDQGASLSGGLRATEIFPDDFLVRIEMAELSGTDAESSEGLAKEYDERAQMALKTIAGIATAIIWLTVAAALIFLIFRIVMFIAGAYSEALSPI